MPTLFSRKQEKSSAGKVRQGEEGREKSEGGAAYGNGRFTAQL
jgi:hypothetical protein